MNVVGLLPTVIGLDDKGIGISRIVAGGTDLLVEQGWQQREQRVKGDAQGGLGGDSGVGISSCLDRKSKSRGGGTCSRFGRRGPRIC